MECSFLNQLAATAQMRCLIDAKRIGYWIASCSETTPKCWSVKIKWCITGCVNVYLYAKTRKFYFLTETKKPTNPESILLF